MTRYHSAESARVRARRQRVEARNEYPHKHKNWNKNDPRDCGNPRCGICHSIPRGHPRKWKEGS